MAGDVLFPDEPGWNCGLGLIAAGPWGFVGTWSFRSEKTDGLIARLMIETTCVMSAMSTFQSFDRALRLVATTTNSIPSPKRITTVCRQCFAGVDRHDRPFDSDKKRYLERRLLEQKQKLCRPPGGAYNQVAKISSPGDLTEIDTRVKESDSKLVVTYFLMIKKVLRVSGDPGSTS